jgi:hypothetical protein
MLKRGTDNQSKWQQLRRPNELEVMMSLDPRDMLEALGKERGALLSQTSSIALRNLFQVNISPDHEMVKSTIRRLEEAGRQNGTNPASTNKTPQSVYKTPLGSQAEWDTTFENKAYMSPRGSQADKFNGPRELFGVPPITSPSTAVDQLSKDLVQMRTTPDHDMLAKARESRQKNYNGPNTSARRVLLGSDSIVEPDTDIFDPDTDFEQDEEDHRGPLPKPRPEIQYWFITHLVEKIHNGPYVTFIIDEKDEGITRDMFAKFWEVYEPQWYGKIGCALPNVDHFRRLDGKPAERDDLHSLLHDEAQQKLILGTYGTLHPSPKSLIPESDEQVVSCYQRAFARFRKFDFDGQRKMWWPSPPHTGLVDLTSFLEGAKNQYGVLCELRERALPLTDRRGEESKATMEMMRGPKEVFALYYNNGSSAYAEPTVSSVNLFNDNLNRVCTQEEKQHQINGAALFLDIGVGSGALLGGVAGLKGIDMLGIEYSEERVKIYLRNVLSNPSDRRRIRTPLKFALVAKNVLDIAAIGLPVRYKTLFVYLGDEAFPKPEMFHILSLLNDITCNVIVISTKAGRHAEFKGFWDLHGYETQLTFKWSKAGSNEKGTMSISRRQTKMNLRRGIAGIATEPDPQVKEAIERCLGSEEERTKYNRELLERIESKKYEPLLYGPSEDRKGTKKPMVPTPCMPAATLQWCAAPDCKTCKSYFMHAPNSIRKSMSAIAGEGMFAMKGIPKGKFIIKYVGVMVHRDLAVESDYLMDISGGFLIDAEKSTGLHRFVNHCCSGQLYQPNAIFQKWVAHDDQNHVSIAAARDIEAGEEVTVDYHTKWFEPCHCGNCAPRRHVGALGPTGPHKRQSKRNKLASKPPAKRTGGDTVKYGSNGKEPCLVKRKLEGITGGDLRRGGDTVKYGSDR